MLVEKERRRKTDRGFAFRGSRAVPELAGDASSCDPDAGLQAIPLVTTEPVKCYAAAGLLKSPAAWTTELECISQSVPAFAIWQIATLEQCFRRYCNVLQVAGRDVRFRRSCMMLMANAERISETLTAARETRQWPPFNRAAFELRQDCELLAALVAEVR